MSFCVEKKGWARGRKKGKGRDGREGGREGGRKHPQKYTVGHKKHTKMCFAITFVKVDGF